MNMSTELKLCAEMVTSRNHARRFVGDVLVGFGLVGWLVCLFGFGFVGLVCCFRLSACWFCFWGWLRLLLGSLVDCLWVSPKRGRACPLDESLGCLAAEQACSLGQAKRVRSKKERPESCVLQVVLLHLQRALAMGFSWTARFRDRVLL